MRLRMSRDLSVSEACGLLGVTKQAWYAFFKRSFKDAIDEDRILNAFARYERIFRHSESER